MSSVKEIIEKLFSRYKSNHFGYETLVRYLSYIGVRYPDSKVFDISCDLIHTNLYYDSTFKNFTKDYTLLLKKRTIKKDTLIVDKESLAKYSFTRLDTIGDGSCFFHAVFMGIYDNYNNSDTRHRIDIVKRFRGLLSDSISISQWESLNNGKLALSELCHFLSSTYKYNTSFSEFLLDAQLTSNSLDEFVSLLKTNKFARKIVINIDTIKQSLFETYKKKLANPAVWVGTEPTDVDAIQLLGDFLGIDIYIFSVYKKMPYVLPCHSSFSYLLDTHKRRPAVFVLNTGNTHFESMGIFQYYTSGDRYVKKMFYPNDSVVKHLYDIISDK